MNDERRLFDGYAERAPDHPTNQTYFRVTHGVLNNQHTSVTEFSTIDEVIDRITVCKRLSQKVYSVESITITVAVESLYIRPLSVPTELLRNENE